MPRRKNHKVEAMLEDRWENKKQLVDTKVSEEATFELNITETEERDLKVAPRKRLLTITSPDEHNIGTRKYGEPVDIKELLEQCQATQEGEKEESADECSEWEICEYGESDYGNYDEWDLNVNKAYLDDPCDGDGHALELVDGVAEYNVFNSDFTQVRQVVLEVYTNESEKIVDIFVGCTKRHNPIKYSREANNAVKSVIKNPKL